MVLVLLMVVMVVPVVLLLVVVVGGDIRGSDGVVSNGAVADDSCGERSG